MQPLKAALLNVLVIAVAAIIGYGAVKTSLRAFDLRRETQNVREQIAALEAKKAELSERLREWKYPATIERKIKSDLGLKRPGEQVVIVAEPRATSAPIAGEAATGAMPWWRRLISAFFQSQDMKTEQ